MAMLSFMRAALLPALMKSKATAERINCLNNMKQIGLAFRTWALDNADEFPFNVSTNKGGTKELCDRGPGGVDKNGFRHLQVMSNELNTAKVLVCPQDPSKQAAIDFGHMTSSNVTYEVRSGTNVSVMYPEEILTRCPIHGHIGLADGSVKPGGKN